MKNLTFLIGILFFLCSQAQAAPKWSAGVDERIELLTVIQYLAGWQKHADMDNAPYDTQYHWRIKEKFEQYKNHEAVTLLRKLFTQGGFSWDAPPTFMYHLGVLPDLKLEYPLTPDLLKRIGGEKNAEEFISSLRKFAKDTEFHSFFVQNQDYYQRVEKYFLDQIKDPTRYLDFLDQLAGDTRREYTITLSTVFPYNNYAGRIETENGMLTYNTTAPQDAALVDGMVVAAYQRDSIVHLMLHEFGHSVVNPVTEKHLSELNKSQCLFDPLQKNMTKMNYPEWQYCTNEHLVRAIVALYYRLYDGEEKAEKELKDQEKIGFIYIRDFYDLLLGYWNHRKDYKSYDDYYPMIIEKLNSMTGQCQ